MTRTASALTSVDRTFEYVPIGLFGSVMGLSALSVAWRLASGCFGVPMWISASVGALATAAFALIAGAYAIKIVTAPDTVRAEFGHPITGNLFGTFLISLLLLPLVIAPANLLLAQCIWVVGAIGMVAFAWLMIDRWLSNQQQIAQATPAWFVPVVGMLDLPLAVPVLGIPHTHGMMVMGLAVGSFFAVPLFTLVFARLLFAPPMPDAMQPTLMILLAPFAVGTTAYIAVAGHVDLFAQLLYALTLFMLVALGARLRHLVACCPFRIAWWAVSFPIAAAAIAGLRIAAASPSGLADMIAALLLAVATITVFALLVRTVIGVVQGELRELSG